MRGDRIAIVTPWWNRAELFENYDRAVKPELRDGDELLIVDDASDPSLSFGTMRSDVNRGFSGACNLGLRTATAEVVLFLNNDVGHGQPGWLSAIRESVEPGVLVGPLRLERHADVDGTRMPYIDGWCLAGHREDLLELGGFDETLDEPAYYSDNLLCLEARAAGMTLRDVPVGLLHMENATNGRTPRVRDATLRNQERYLARARELLVAI